MVSSLHTHGNSKKLSLSFELSHKLKSLSKMSHNSNLDSKLTKLLSIESEFWVDSLFLVSFEPEYWVQTHSQAKKNNHVIENK